ncbi:MAG: hypothetical protein ACQER4_02055 [Bacteroidota bacterium]
MNLVANLFAAGDEEGMSVRALTETWIEKLPVGHELIGREQLNRSSWPEWLAEWVEQEVVSWIRESLTLPDIPLARMDAKDVLESWRQFETTVVRHWALPSNEIRPLLEEAAGDLLALLARPEERIPDLLFGTETSVDRELLAARLERVVVHQDLARALLRYAERKELERVDRELAVRIIAQVDQKLKERYDADAWANQLAPLFEIWGGSVPSGVIRKQLEARGADAAGRIPDGEELWKIEWVVKELQKGAHEEEASIPSSLSDLYGVQRDEDPGEQVPSVSDEEARDEESPRTLSDLYGSASEESEPVEPEEDSDRDELSLHRRFQFDEPDMDRYLEEEARDPESRTDESKEDSGRVEPEAETPLSLYAKPAEEPAEPDEGGDENAIWKKFLSPDEEVESQQQERDSQREENSEQAGPEESESASSSGSANENAPSVGWLDPTEPAAGTGTSAVVRDLERWLGSDLDRFRREIFDGSDEGLRMALRDLVQMESWGNAARYLQDDVFDRYRIDLFDDAAVDFTDRMQAWFEE